MTGYVLQLLKFARPMELMRVEQYEADRVSLALEEKQDGVIVLVDGPPRPLITPGGFGVLLLAFLLFKASLMAGLGQETYAGAIHELERGTLLEQMGAFIMAPDLVSQMIANGIAALPN